MGWQVNPDVVANTVIVTGPSGVVVGIFVYAIGTTPGLGNPPVEWMSQFLADPFGNVLPTAGIASELSGGGAWCTLVNGQVILGASSSQPLSQATIMSMPNSGEFQTVGPLESSGDTSVTTLFVSNTASGGTGPQYRINNGALISKGGTAANPSVISSDTWHTLTLTDGTGTVQYSYIPAGPNNLGCVMLQGEIVLNAATAANTTVATIPYGPLTQHSYVTPNNLAGYALGNRVVNVTTGGAIQIAPTGANTNFVQFDGIVIPLG